MKSVAERGDRLVVDRLVRLDRHVAAGEPGAAGRDHHVDPGIGDPCRAAAPRSPPDRRAPAPGRRADAPPPPAAPPGVARGVLRPAAAVGDGQHRDPHRQERPLASAIEPRLQHQEIRPGLALLLAVAQQRRRMPGRDRRHPAPVVPAPAQPGHPVAGGEHGADRRRAEEQQRPPAAPARCGGRGTAASSAASSPEGSRFCGGRHGSTLVI